MRYCVIFGAVYCCFKNIHAVYGFNHLRCAILMSFCAVFGSPLHPLKLQSQVLSCDTYQVMLKYIYISTQRTFVRLPYRTEVAQQFKKLFIR